MVERGAKAIDVARGTDGAAAVVLLAGLSGAALGYLRHNFNPSRIIMGDAGSTLFGYTLAAVSLLGTLKFSAGASLLVPLIVLALPLLDTTQVVIGRLARGIRAGQVFVNNYGAGGGIELPFGGVRRSGFGREKGFEGLRSFAALKTVAIRHG